VPVLALSNGDVILIIVAIAIPLGLLSFVLGAGNAFDEIGKGPFAMDHDPVASKEPAAPITPAVREAEIRQMLEAKAYRQSSRGQTPLDVDAELSKLLASAPGAGLGSDPGLRAEVRDLVVARNHRRVRQGKEPLDVETEIERQLRDLENLGQ
jgi:hypothetical protein